MGIPRLVFVWALAGLFVVASGLTSCGPGGGPQMEPVRPAMAVAEEPTRPVVHSRTVIAKGRRIRPDWLEVRSVPASRVPTEEGYFERIEDLVGMETVEDVPQGVSVLKTFARSVGAIGLSDLIAPGMVAIAIPTSAVTAMPFLAPGHRVDVLGTLKVPGLAGGAPRMETLVVVKNARVLAVHLSFDPGPYATRDQTEEVPTTRAGRGARASNLTNPYQGRDEIRSVTIEVEPKMAQKLALAMEMTKVLRLAAYSEVAADAHFDEVRISDQFFAAELEDREQDPARKLPSGQVGELVVIQGGTERRVTWSRKSFDEPYDEDADAPLEQDGVPTGVVERRHAVLLPPQDADLLTPIDDDDLVVSMPSLPK